MACWPRRSPPCRARPGSSVGGVVAYATELKQDAARGGRRPAGRGRRRAPAGRGRDGGRGAPPARRRLGLATTGVAGPDPQDGHPPGTVWVGVADARGSWAVEATTDPAPGRAAVRAQTVRTALAAAVRLLTGEDPPALFRVSPFGVPCRRGAPLAAATDGVRWSLQGEYVPGSSGPGTREGPGRRHGAAPSGDR